MVIGHDCTNNATVGPLTHSLVIALHAHRGFVVMDEQGGVVTDHAGVGMAVEFRSLFQQACLGPQ